MASLSVRRESERALSRGRLRLGACPSKTRTLHTRTDQPATHPRDHRSLPLAALVALAGSFWTSAGILSGGIAHAVQTNIAISMTGPPAAPRILGPKSFSAKPGTPFLYTIAATGQPPLTFAVTGLPSGLTLAGASGTISGMMPAVGSYPVNVTVTSAAGTATGTLTLVSGDTLSLTPPMGWNSFDSFGSTVTENEMILAAQAQKALLQPFGWNYVVLDYLWFDPEQVIDANGRYLPSPSRFPMAAGSMGLKPLSDRIHALGLNFGLHIMRGISRKTYTANTPILGTTFTATAAGNTADTCPWDSHMWGVRGDTAAGQAWYDSIFAQYAAWGVDFVKVDDMIKNNAQPFVYHQAEVQAIRAAIDKTGRSMVLSLSPGAMQPADVVHLNANANMWRIVDDFWDLNGSSTLPDVFNTAAVWQALSGINVGHWPDADMLPLGFLGPRSQKHPAPGTGTAFSHNEQVAIISLWSILPSPLIFGGNVSALSTDATGPWTTALLTNEEVLAVNQDVLGSRAKLILQQGTTEVWARDLSGGRKAVALFNRGTQDAPVSVTFAEIGISGTPAVRDLWHRMDVAGMTTGVSVTVPFNGALMYTLTPTNAGGGGAGGGAGAGGSTARGTGGGAPIGGATGSAGTGGGSVVAGSGGTVGMTDAGAGSGGATAGGGSGGGAGRAGQGPAGPGAASTGTSSGCACTIGADRGLRALFGSLPVGLLAVAFVARRGHRRRRSDGI